MALAEDGKFLGMNVDLMGNMGAYLSTFAARAAPRRPMGWSDWLTPRLASSA